MQKLFGSWSFAEKLGKNWRYILAIVILLLFLLSLVKCGTSPHAPQNPTQKLPSKVKIWQDTVNTLKTKIVTNESNRKAAIDSIRNLYDNDLQRAIDSDYNYPDR